MKEEIAKILANSKKYPIDDEVIQQVKETGKPCPICKILFENDELLCGMCEFTP